MLLSFFKISRLQLFPLPKTASGSQSNTTRSRRRGRRTVGSPCRRSALHVDGQLQCREVCVRQPVGGFRRPAASDQEQCGDAGRGNPVYHSESVRARLFGDVEPVVGEHVVERLSE